MQASVFVLLIVAVVAANLPFFTNRLAGFIPVSDKHAGWRLLELVVLYFAVGLFARMLEANQGPVHEQHWQFYATTFALFLVFAFPGFVARYFWRHRGP
jgi:hypothetical protein